jgi:hypothetical protein
MQPTDERIRKIIGDARMHSRTLERRVLWPAIVLGTVLIVVGVTSFFALAGTPYRALTSCLIPLSLVAFNGAIMPTYRWSIRTIVGVFAISLVALGCDEMLSAAPSLPLLPLPGIALLLGTRESCAVAPHLSLAGEGATTLMPCTFIEVHVYITLLEGATLVAIGLRVALAFRHWRLPRLMLHDLWRALFWVVVEIGWLCCRLIAAGVFRSLSGYVIAGHTLLVLALALILYLHARPRVRERFYAWRLRQGAAVTSAGGIAALISAAGGGDGAVVVASGLASLRSLRVDLLTREHMASNAPDVNLYELTEHAHVGEIDVRRERSSRPCVAEREAVLRSPAHALAPWCIATRSRARPRYISPPR